MTKHKVLIFAAGAIIFNSSLLFATSSTEITSRAITTFDDIATKLKNIDSSNIANSDTLAWSESYILKAYVAMYEGTSDLKYLTEAMRRFDNILSNRDDITNTRDEIRNKIMPCWSTKGYTKGKRYTWLVHCGMITYPMARVVYIIKKNPQLKKTFDEKAAAYEKAVIETLNAFEQEWRDGPNESEGFYYDPYLEKPMPFNQQNAMGRTIVSLWLATGEQKYKERAAMLAKYLKNRLKVRDNYYIWPYWSQSGGAEDISHAAINLDFMFQCYRAGIVFNKDDMLKLVNTFKNFSKGENGFAKRVDGTGDFEYSAQAGRWGHLAFIDNDIRRILFAFFIQGHKDTKLANQSGGVGGLIAAAYIAETAKPISYEKPVQ